MYSYIWYGCVIVCMKCMYVCMYVYVLHMYILLYNNLSITMNLWMYLSLYHYHLSLSQLSSVFYLLFLWGHDEDMRNEDTGHMYLCTIIIIVELLLVYVYGLLVLWHTTRSTATATTAGLRPASWYTDTPRCLILIYLYILHILPMIL